MKKIVDLPHNKKMTAVIGAVSAFFIILAVVIFCCVSGGSPEKVATKYADYMNDGKASKAISYLAVDYEGFINDALAEDNVNDIVKQNGSGKEYTAKDYYAELGSVFGNSSAANADDVYKAFLNSYSEQYKGKFKNFEIVDSSDVSVESDEVKSAVESSQRLVKAFNTDKLNSKKYFNEAKVKKAVKLNVTYVKDNKVQNAVWIAVKIGTNWKILSVN